MRFKSLILIRCLKNLPAKFLKNVIILGLLSVASSKCVRMQMHLVEARLHCVDDCF